MTLDLIKHNGPTPADVTAPQIITDCGNVTLDFKQLGFYASLVFLQTVISKWNEKFTFIFGPLSNSPVLFQHISLPNFFLSVNFAFNMLWYSTLWTATPFSNDSLWLTLFVEGVNDHCQVSCLSPLLWFQRTRDTHNLYCMDGHLLKLKCKYSNILRYWFLACISCKL